MKPVENPAAFLYRTDIKPPPGPSSEKKKATGKSFLSLFRTAAETERSGVEAEGDVAADKAQLEAQLDLIHDIGQKLLKQQTLDQVKAYKTAIKSFMQHFLRYGMETEEVVSSSRNIMNQKKYTIIRVIDEKLERLVTGILQSQVKQMEILSKLEEIQGLLVNLVH